MADADARQTRLGGADDVPSGRVEMNDVPQRRIDDLAMRIVCDHRHARHRLAPADHPIIAAEIRRGEPRVRRDERRQCASRPDHRRRRGLLWRKTPAQVVRVARDVEDGRVDISKVETFGNDKRLLRIGGLQLQHLLNAHRLHVERALHFTRRVARESPAGHAREDRPSRPVRSGTESHDLEFDRDLVLVERLLNGRVDTSGE